MNIKWITLPISRNNRVYRVFGSDTKCMLLRIYPVEDSSAADLIQQITIVAGRAQTLNIKEYMCMLRLKYGIVPNSGYIDIPFLETIVGKMTKDYHVTMNVCDRALIRYMELYINREPTFDLVSKYILNIRYIPEIFFGSVAVKLFTPNFKDVIELVSGEKILDINTVFVPQCPDAEIHEDRDGVYIKFNNTRPASVYVIYGYNYPTSFVSKVWKFITNGA